MKQVKIIEKALEKFKNINSPKQLLVGFDGFVDEIIHVVDKRQNHDNYERIKYIETFSERIAQCAGLSANIELVPIQTKVGGNGPIMANAVMAQGHEVVYIGALGQTQIDPVFKEVSERFNTVISLTDPGHTDALEFYDGKIMLGKMNNLVEVSWDKLTENISKQEIEKILSNTELVAFTNWTMLSNLNSIMIEFDNIIKTLKNKPKVFIDLADPKKRTDEDVLEVLKIISNFESNTVLSMNQNESTIISQVLDIKDDDIESRANKLRQKLDISAIVIHPVKGATISHNKENRWIDGPYTPEPKLTTGAGDNFNAGFCNGWINGLEPSEAIAVGVCTSGFYVRNGYSPSKSELSKFMAEWIDKNCGEI